LLVGIEKFMSECRALTNVVGNGVATLVVSRWQGELDPGKMRNAMESRDESSAPDSA
jgi:aerobic C4-dicarboxylate transport protein